MNFNYVLLIRIVGTVTVYLSDKGSSKWYHQSESDRIYRKNELSKIIRRKLIYRKRFIEKINLSKMIY
jgi:hypothetical protein